MIYDGELQNLVVGTGVSILDIKLIWFFILCDDFSLSFLVPTTECESAPFTPLYKPFVKASLSPYAVTWSLTIFLCEGPLEIELLYDERLTSLICRKLMSLIVY